MTVNKAKMPRLNQERPDSKRLRCEIPVNALEAWNPSVKAAVADQENTISILDPIGDWPDEVGAKRIRSALARIGSGNPVDVYINSPGGDVFEGLAIYNLFREHDGPVNMKVMGLAASAASLIAMAGDTIEIARAGFYMVHDVWSLVIGNRNDLREFADFLEPLDRALADVYAARTGIDIDSVLSMMDAETWLGGQDAIGRGFADELLPADQIEESGEGGSQSNAARKLDVALAKAGLTRNERRQMLNDFKAGTPSATGAGTPSAADDAMPSASEVTAGEPLPSLELEFLSF